MRAELIDVRNEARHARDREAAATAKLERAIAASAADNVGPSRRRRRHVGRRRDARRAADRDRRRAGRDPRWPVAFDGVDRCGHRARRGRAGGPQRCRLRQLARTDKRRVLRVVDRCVSPAACGPRRPRPPPISSAPGARVLIDGYNVSMLGWPNLSIDEQRSALVNTVENMTLRFGTDATVVFDGADVVGAHSLRRRSTRVLFSPSGVIADDVIRAEVERTPAARHVVVVTNERRSPTTCAPPERTCSRATPCSPCSERPLTPIGVG